MSHHRDRHAVLSSNIANVETPGYRPLELEPDAPGERAMPMTTSDDAHFSSAPDTPRTGSLVVSDDGDARPDGNTVALDKQMARLNANRLRYSASAAFISRRLALLRYAATDGNG